MLDRERERLYAIIGARDRGRPCAGSVQWNGCRGTRGAEPRRRRCAWRLKTAGKSCRPSTKNRDHARSPESGIGWSRRQRSTCRRWAQFDHGDRRATVPPAARRKIGASAFTFCSVGSRRSGSIPGGFDSCWKCPKSWTRRNVDRISVPPSRFAAYRVEPDRVLVAARICLSHERDFPRLKKRIGGVDRCLITS